VVVVGLFTMWKQGHSLSRLHNEEQRVTTKKGKHEMKRPTARIWSGIYCQNQFGEDVEAALRELSCAHPEWRLDYDFAWDFCEEDSIYHEEKE